LEKRADACSILIGNPFGTAGAPPGESEESKDEGLTVEQRLVRNQAIVRGSPVIRRALVSAGTSLVAAGVAIHRKPPVTKQFQSVALHDRKRSLQVQRPKTWRQDLRAERKTTRYYKDYKHNILGSPGRSPDPFAQKRYYERLEQKRHRRKAVRLGSAGGTLIMAGKLVPTIGYGIIISSYLSYDGYGNIPTGIDLGKVKSDADVLVERQRSMIDYGRQKAGEAYAAYRALDMIWSAVQ
jgi:hypothetical protein